MLDLNRLSKKAAEVEREAEAAAKAAISAKEAMTVSSRGLDTAIAILTATGSIDVETEVSQERGRIQSSPIPVGKLDGPGLAANKRTCFAKVFIDRSGWTVGDHEDYEEGIEAEKSRLRQDPELRGQLLRDRVYLYGAEFYSGDEGAQELQLIDAVMCETGSYMPTSEGFRYCHISRSSGEVVSRTLDEIKSIIGDNN